LSEKIIVAMSQSVGPPECETVGVTCTVKFDKDAPTLQNPEPFHSVVHSAAVACHEALHEAATPRS
jgi:hypothetical protein